VPRPFQRIPGIFDSRLLVAWGTPILRPAKTTISCFRSDQPQHTNLELRVLWTRRCSKSCFCNSFRINTSATDCSSNPSILRLVRNVPCVLHKYAREGATRTSGASNPSGFRSTTSSRCPDWRAARSYGKGGNENVDRLRPIGDDVSQTAGPYALLCL